MKQTTTPSKAFRQLNTYVKHYTGKELDINKIYCASIGGKRGVQYGDEYEPRPLGDKCFVRALENLRKNRCQGMTIAFQYESEKHVDPEEMRTSIEHEVEWEGFVVHTARFTVFNPKGKVKSIIML